MHASFFFFCALSAENPSMRLTLQHLRNTDLGRSDSLIQSSQLCFCSFFIPNKESRKTGNWYPPLRPYHAWTFFVAICCVKLASLSTRSSLIQSTGHFERGTRGNAVPIV